MQVSAGGGYTCATAFSGKGSACFGQDNVKQGARGLAAVLGKGVKLQQVSAGRDHTCGTTATFKLWCWGGDYTKQVSPIPGGANCTDLDSKLHNQAKSCLSSGWLQV